MNHLSEHVEQAIVARKLFRRGQRLLVAASGGVDSMALLRLLHALAPKHGWRLTVAHFNHQLRGRSSDADERLVRQTAKKLGLPFVGGRADVRRFARVGKLSIEMAARRLRHDFLARTAKRLKIPTIALAHHADDQVELFFLRLLRGGGEGLAGMKWRSMSPAGVRSPAFTRSGRLPSPPRFDATRKAGLQTELVRPLLDVSKGELETYARESKIQFREDASNRSLNFLRNRIRGELLPRLRKHYSPALDRVVLRTMEIIGAESEFVNEAGREWLKKHRPFFSELTVAVQRRVLQLQLLATGTAPAFDLIEQLRGEADVPAAVGTNLTVMRNAAGTLQLTRLARSAGLRPGSERKSLWCQIGGRHSGTVVFGGKSLHWKIERQMAFRRPKRTMGREFFDAKEVGERIVLRHWRAGDRFQPIGMKVAVKLQDLFVNAKIPRSQRLELLVAATAGGEIFWVEGLRIGDRFKLTARTARRLRWEWAKAV